MADDKPSDPEDRVAIPLDPEEALRALLQVDPDSEPVEPDAARRGHRTWQEIKDKRAEQDQRGESAPRGNEKTP